MRARSWSTGALRAGLLCVAASLHLSRAAYAHEDVTPPVLLDEPTAVWPEGHALANDLIIPIVFTVSPQGIVEAVELEAGVGEPFDSQALAAAQKLHFKPAQDKQGPRRARVRGIVRFLGISPPPLEPTPTSVPTPPPAPDTAVASTTAPVVTPQLEPQAVATTMASRETESAPEVIVEGELPPRSASEARIERPVLEAAPHKSAAEMLLTVPGVFVSQHGGEGKAHQIFFRGFDAAHGQDVELWAAGAPVNEVSNIHGQGYADLHFLIPEVIREIRSTPGTYDPKQGDFAVAGTMRFALGYDEPGVTAKASMGSFGSRRFFMAYRPKDAPPESFGAFELASTNGFGPSRAARHASGMGQAVFDLAAGVRGRVMASTYAGRFDSAGVVRLADVESGAIGRFDTYDGKQGGQSSRSQLVLELTGESGAERDVGPDRWTIAPYVVLRSLELRSNFTGYLTSAEGDSIQQVNDATTLGATASYLRRLPLLSSQDTLEAGISLRNDQISQSQHRLSLVNDRVTDDERAPGVEADVVASNVAGYLDVALHPVPRVALRGGLRADGLSYRVQEHECAPSDADCTGGAGQVRSAAGAQLSTRGTLDVRVASGLDAIASYGEGFRSPQARSLGDGETTPFTRVVSYEVGLRYRQAGAFETSAALYRTTLSDDLVFDQATARNELVSGTSRQGVALSLMARPSPWLLSSTSFTYARAAFEADGGMYRAGDLLPYVPQLVARSDLAFTPTLGVLGAHEVRSHVGLGLTYLGRRPLPYDEYGHDVFLVDASAELRWGPIETGLAVFNLLDADWYDGEFVYASAFEGDASLVPIRHVTVGPPRAVLWSLTLFL